MGHTLEELRARFAADRSDNKGTPTLDKVSVYKQGMGEKVATARARSGSKVYFERTVDGQDARLTFGKYSGRLLSDLSSFDEGVSYLRWIASKDFPEELLELAKAHTPTKGGA